jgi:UDP-N-acetylmuramoyl-L-alanyl-D-glutamate--2,6-diaminopimelate ligase
MKFLAFLGNIFFRHPSHKLFVVGVTGTKGKSTTLEIMSAIMESAGYTTAILSTVRRKVADKSVVNDGNTMPGRFAIQQFFNDAIRAGCRYAFVEVTSQGVSQHRHRFIDWNVAVITNIEPEHIEAHGGFEKYREAKLNFFRYVASGSHKRPRLFFINTDGSGKEYYNYKPFEQVARDAVRSRVFLTNKEELLKSLESEYGWDREAIERDNLWFSASFNLENTALAVSFARDCEVSWNVIGKALRDFGGVSGRLQFVQREPFSVVVDYAHTPGSLRRLYEFLKPSEGRKLICVLGATGGGRDKGKRPEMGRVAGEFCDEVILTNEDPYNEDPLQIIEGLAEDLGGRDIYKIVDRRKAIVKAVSLAKEGDVIALTGKGSQTSIAVSDGKKILWSDEKVARDVLGITKERV